MSVTSCDRLRNLTFHAAGTQTFQDRSPICSPPSGQSGYKNGVQFGAQCASNGRSAHLAGVATGSLPSAQSTSRTERGSGFPPEAPKRSSPSGRRAGESYCSAKGARWKWNGSDCGSRHTKALPLIDRPARSFRPIDPKTDDGSPAIGLRRWGANPSPEITQRLAFVDRQTERQRCCGRAWLRPRVQEILCVFALNISLRPAPSDCSDSVSGRAQFRISRVNWSAFRDTENCGHSNMAFPHQRNRFQVPLNRLCRWMISAHAAHRAESELRSGSACELAIYH